MSDAEKSNVQFIECYQKNFLNKPFKLLVDLRGFKPATQEVQKKISEVSDSVIQYVSANAIVSDSFLSQSQVKRMSKEKGTSDKVSYFADYNEAYDWLKTK